METKITVWTYAILATIPLVGLDVLYVVLLSALFGSLGGIAASLRMKLLTKFDLINHAANMGCFGAGVSLFGLWYFETNEQIKYLLIGISGLCGLVGLPIFDPFTKFITNLINRIFENANVSSKGSPNDRNNSNKSEKSDT